MHREHLCNTFDILSSAIRRILTFAQERHIKKKSSFRFSEKFHVWLLTHETAHIHWIVRSSSGSREKSQKWRHKRRNRRFATFTPRNVFFSEIDGLTPVGVPLTDQWCFFDSFMDLKPRPNATPRLQSRSDPPRLRMKLLKLKKRIPRSFLANASFKQRSEKSPVRDIWISINCVTVCDRGRVGGLVGWLQSQKFAAGHGWPRQMAALNPWTVKRRLKAKLERDEIWVSLRGLCFSAEGEEVVGGSEGENAPSCHREAIQTD